MWSFERLDRKLHGFILQYLLFSVSWTKQILQCYRKRLSSLIKLKRLDWSLWHILHFLSKEFRLNKRILKIFYNATVFYTITLSLSRVLRLDDLWCRLWNACTCSLPIASDPPNEYLQWVKETMARRLQAFKLLPPRLELLRG